MSDTALDRIVDALRGQGREVKADDGKALAQCPAHDDGNPSLSISRRRDGKGIVIKCHAGCETSAVVAAIGWTMADLFDEPKVRDIFSPRRDYRYPGGRVVHRKPGKSFPQSGAKDTDRSLFGSDQITDTTTTVYAVEGEKDVEAVQAAGGVAVCSAMGAGKAHLADWSALDGKNVILVPDRDDPGRKHATAIAAIIGDIAKSVTIVEPVDGKDFADHFVADYGLEDLVVQDSDSSPKSSGEQVQEAVRPIWPSPSAPLEVARKLYRDFRTPENIRTLVSWRGGWMEWKTTQWAELDTAQLRSQAYDKLGEVDYNHPIREKGVIVDYEIRPWSPDKHKIANVMEAMQAVGHVSADIDPPSWIAHSAAKTTASQVISCTNGLLDLTNRTLIEHTPAFFNMVAVPFAYQSSVPAPRAWLDFLASVWPDDPQSIALLQEYVGYVLSGRTDMQKMLLLIGPTRSGKGTIARMLTELVGRGHVAGPTLASLGTNFGLSPLLGKPLAIISDARLGTSPAHTVVERLLSITGEDLMTVDRKFRDPWSGKLPARFVVLSNELPRFRDASGAIANRMLILQMTNSFLGREDRTLDDRLSAELPGILAWALEGLDRLTANGRFTVPGSSQDAADLMADLASPVSAFVRDKCLRKPDATVEADVLYSAWKTWAEDNGHHAGAKSSFGRDLRAVVPEIKMTSPRKSGVPVRTYACIGLQPSSPSSVDENAGQGGGADEGASPPIPHQLFGHQPANPGDEGYPSSVQPIKPQVKSGDEGDEGTSAFKAQVKASDNGQKDAYRAGVCIDCRDRKPSAGRPRCDECHRRHQRAECRHCGAELPEHMPSQRQRGYCSKASCGNREKERRITEAGRR